MPSPKILSREDILRAMRLTKSNRAAAKYLGCSYQHYKPYAKLFKLNIFCDSINEYAPLFDAVYNVTVSIVPGAGQF